VGRFGGFANANVIGVSADGVLLAIIMGRSPDLDRDGTVGLSDLAMFARRYSSEPYEPEIDYDGCPDSQLADFAFFAQEYLTSTNFPPALLCP
jgi:hypothetical protein